MEKVSVCITLFNEGKGISRVLRYLDLHAALIDQVIIVSDVCVDCTDQIVLDWIHHTALERIFIQRNKRNGRADAIRECLKASSNDLNVFLAGDISPVGDSLSNLICYFENSEVGAVTGHPVLINEKRSLADYLSFLIWSSHDAIGKKQTERGLFFHLNGEMFAIRKHCLSGFDHYDGLAEDALIGALIRRNGFKVLWADDVTYLMKYPSDLNEYLKVRKRCCYARIELWKLCNLQKYPFYEVSHPEYLINVLQSCDKSFKGILALLFGAAAEILARIYYRFTIHRKRNVFDELWKPAEGTKW